MVRRSSDLVSTVAVAVSNVAQPTATLPAHLTVAPRLAARVCAGLTCQRTDAPCVRTRQIPDYLYDGWAKQVKESGSRNALELGTLTMVKKPFAREAEVPTPLHAVRQVRHRFPCAVTA